MVTCKQFLQELNDYLDESVGPDIRRELEAHVTECPNCWVIVDTTKKTLEVYKGMQPQPVPDHIKSRLMLALEKKMRSKRQQT